MEEKHPRNNNYTPKMDKDDYNWGPVHTKPEEFKYATIASHFGFVFEENYIVFEKLCF